MTPRQRFDYYLNHDTKERAKTFFYVVVASLTIGTIGRYVLRIPEEPLIYVEGLFVVPVVLGVQIWRYCHKDGHS